MKKTGLGVVLCALTLALAFASAPSDMPFPPPHGGLSPVSDMPFPPPSRTADMPFPPPSRVA